jgi:hypothetical protein
MDGLVRVAQGRDRMPPIPHLENRMLVCVSNVHKEDFDESDSESKNPLSGTSAYVPQRSP